MKCRTETDTKSVDFGAPEVDWESLTAEWMAVNNSLICTRSTRCLLWWSQREKTWRVSAVGLCSHVWTWHPLMCTTFATVGWKKAKLCSNPVAKSITWESSRYGCWSWHDLLSRNTPELSMYLLLSSGVFLLLVPQIIALLASTHLLRQCQAGHD